MRSHPPEMASHFVLKSWELASDTLGKQYKHYLSFLCKVYVYVEKEITLCFSRVPLVDWRAKLL
jgi:hypothetical protein